MPQGIAYAIVAGLPPQYGLYSAYLGCFVYCLLGRWIGIDYYLSVFVELVSFFFSTKDVTIGPTAIMAIMTGEVFSGDKEVCDNYFSNTCCSLHIFFWLQPYGIYYAPLLAFFTGVIVFICGNLRYTFSIVLIFNMITVLMIIIIKDN